MRVVHFFLILLFLTVVAGGPHQRRLIRHLLNDQQYDVFERPVRNDSDTLPVSMNLALQQVVDFDGKHQVIIISGWLVLAWRDYSLTWNPEEYGNIETIRISSAQIWTPDVLLYNSADEKFDSAMKVNAVVRYTGDVLYVPPGIFKSICPFNIASFPFDTQSCTLKFGSWTYDESGINLTAQSDKGQLDAYIKNTQWDLEDFTAVNNALKYDCCPDLYPFVLFTIRIRRRSLYYVTNIVVPCFFISCMTILGFLLAPDSGEKLTLQITTLLSVVTFSLLLSDIMPPSSTDIPVITMYFLCVMCMSTLSVTVSVFVISLHFRNSKNYSMPLWISKYICCYLAWLLRMKRPGQDLTWKGICHRWSSVHNQSKPIHTHHSKCPNGTLSNHRPPLQFFSVHHEQKPSDSNSVASFAPTNLSTISHSYETEMIAAELRGITSQLTFITDHIWREEKHDNDSQDWRFVAMVIDRFCLILFLFFMIVFTTLILLSACHLYSYH